MVIALFGDSCTGKSTIAAALAPSLSAEVFSGKDYLKLAKSESMAAALFQKKLRGEETILYVISEKDQLALLPEGCVRVLVTAGLAAIKERLPRGCTGICPPRWPLCWSGNTAGLRRRPTTCGWTRTPFRRRKPPMKSDCC